MTIFFPMQCDFLLPVFFFFSEYEFLFCFACVVIFGWKLDIIDNTLSKCCITLFVWGLLDFSYRKQLTCLDSKVCSTWYFVLFLWISTPPFLAWLPRGLSPACITWLFVKNLGSNGTHTFSSFLFSSSRVSSLISSLSANLRFYLLTIQAHRTSVFCYPSCAKVGMHSIKQNKTENSRSSSTLVLS